MKLVRKNDDFIVIESNGSFHKVLLSEIDDLIVLLAEAKRVPTAKANKSIGEDLFPDQERARNIAGPSLRYFHQQYALGRKAMDMCVKMILPKAPVEDSLPIEGMFGSPMRESDYLISHLTLPPLPRQFYIVKPRMKAVLSASGVELHVVEPDINRLNALWGEQENKHES